MTNILLLERAAAYANAGSLVRDFETSTNADWRDGFPFVIADGIVPTVDAGNAGNGVFSALAVDASAAPGVYRVVIATIIGGATYYDLQNTNADVLARGVVGAPFSYGGLSFTLGAGSAPWAVGDGLSLTITSRMLDISGINAVLTLRPALNGATGYTALVSLLASTQAGTLVNGGTAGVISASVPASAMAKLVPGAPGQPAYDYDLVMSAEGATIRTFRGQIYHAAGVTYS